jgi:hypothetical protein
MCIKYVLVFQPEYVRNYGKIRSNDELTEDREQRMVDQGCKIKMKLQIVTSSSPDIIRMNVATQN